MGKKYIIELPENTHWIQWLMEGTEDHHPYMDFKGIKALTPYTEPDLEQVRKEAYEKGYDDAKSGYDNGFENGMIVAWEAARKIIHMPEGDLLELFDVYSSVCTPVQVMLKYDATEAIAKIKEYEDGKQKINVGDEVGYYGVADEHGNVNYSGVVLEIREEDYLVMEKDGKTYSLKKKFVLTKTGRHFPEIAAVLEKMQEGVR